MYGPSFFLSTNPLNRYAIVSDTPGLHFGNDGSLTIYVQSQAPTSPVEQANWLPRPPAHFKLMLRLYQPAKVCARRHVEASPDQARNDRGNPTPTEPDADLAELRSAQRETADPVSHGPCPAHLQRQPSRRSPRSS